MLPPLHIILNPKVQKSNNYYVVKERKMVNFKLDETNVKMN